MQRLLCLVTLIIYVASNALAQELNATVSISASKIEASYRDRFETLKQDLEEFINGQQWTQAQFAVNEKIQCTFAFIINSMPETNKYTASLTIQARRPVYNSSYNTVTLNWKDDELTFEYTEGQNLTYNEFNLQGDLIATIAYYCYLIIGMDFETFSEKGGENYLRKCENIATQMQASENPGWKAFDSKSNRHALITALLEEQQADFRSLWYIYHRLGLDAMAQSMDKGRNQVTKAIGFLGGIRKANPQTPLLSLFINAKLDELLNIYSEAPMTEKLSIFKTLEEDYPTYSSQLNKLKQEYKE